MLCLYGDEEFETSGGKRMRNHKLWTVRPPQITVSTPITHWLVEILPMWWKQELVEPDAMNKHGPHVTKATTSQSCY